MVTRFVASTVLSAFALLASVGAVGCSASASDDAEAAADQHLDTVDDALGSEASTAWASYVREATAPTLQSGCTPYALAPAAGHAYRGTALLLHGYSACPQQYDAIAKKMSAEGYAVLVPLLPGHGHVASFSSSGKATDDSSALPDDAHYQEYGTFAKQMADIVAKATDGDHVVMGLSVGGAVAASAAAQSPGTFSRVLLMNAFFDISGGFGSTITPILGAIAPQFPFGWGPGCETERAQGRAGICSFKVTNLRAVQHFGQDTLAQVGNITAHVQVAGVENDPAASTDAEVTAATTIDDSVACFYEKGVPHSNFAPQDNPGVNMYWLADLLAETTSFLADGTDFATAEASTVKPYARCKSH